MSNPKKMSTVTVLKKYLRKDDKKEVLPDGSTPLYISQWIMVDNKKTCKVSSNMEAKARTFTERALTQDGKKKAGKETGEENFPVQVRCMRHPYDDSTEQLVKEQVANALSFDVWYDWLNGEKNILTKEKFNGTVILDYHGFSGIEMKVPLSWEINDKKDSEEVKKYKTALNKYCNEEHSYEKEGMNYTSPIHIYHFFLRPMFDLGYDIKKVVFLGCYSASIVQLTLDPMQEEDSPKMSFSMLTEMASVLKRFKRHGITIYGMNRVFMASIGGGLLKVTPGGEHGKSTYNDWVEYKPCQIDSFYKMTNEDREKILDHFISMKSEEGRDWILGAYPVASGARKIYKKETIELLNMDNSSVDFEQVQKTPKKIGNQCKILKGKEFEEEEEVQAGPCLFKSDEEYFYELFPEEKEVNSEEEVLADDLSDNGDEEEQTKKYAVLYIDYDKIDLTCLDEE